MELVSIPVLPHVKSLLLSMFGPEPLQANDNNLLGKEIENILLPYTQTQLFPEKISGETLKIYVSVRLAPYYIRFQHAFSLGCYFEKMFHTLLHSYVSGQVDAGIKQDRAIKNFFLRHSINDELYDVTAARMSLLRHKKRLLTPSN